jgi:hypothetical protein
MTVAAPERVLCERHKPTNGLRKLEWLVDTISLDQAVRLVTDLHYAKGASNTATFRHGLFRREEWPLAVSGAAIWIPPTRAAAEATYSGDWRRVLSLSRLVIAPEVPTNGASFLLSRSVRLIAESGAWDCLVTYADEWQGHTGAIYRAAGWEYVGLTKPERTYVLNGSMIARKAGPKTRTHADMLALGAECVGSFAKHKFVLVLTPAVRKR